MLLEYPVSDERRAARTRESARQTREALQRFSSASRPSSFLSSAVAGGGRAPLLNSKFVLQFYERTRNASTLGMRGLGINGGVKHATFSPEVVFSKLLKSPRSSGRGSVGRSMQRTWLGALMHYIILSMTVWLSRLKRF